MQFGIYRIQPVAISKHKEQKIPEEFLKMQLPSYLRRTVGGAQFMNYAAF